MDWISDVLHSLLLWVESLGAFGIFLGLMLEVIPSEIVLAYGGYLVSQGNVSFVMAIVFGTLGAIGQNWVLYAIGRFGGRPIVDKYGKYLKIKQKHVDVAEGWFKKYGAGIVFTARFVPVMRQVISIPAGMARMNFGLFTLLTALASLPWSIMFVYLGMQLGDRWEQIDEVAGPYIKPFVIVALALAILYFLIKYLRSRSKTI
ncbi:DedA family protein [Paenibacillus sp. SYP-B4298]|uniref:DedA family protein n=1 Tax=Paenibacillus sp. SYP-B4298 TaxID=2996034 RepID=UPI0022DE0F1B|nr:DedA family protein [Paenibacillus sp. SYP-B4298]